jgi:hypothetical protein
MILQELRKHQWRAFRRHPMFERNLALKIFSYFMFGFIGLYLLMIGFLIYDIISEHGAYNDAIDSFNYVLLYFFLFDFVIKYLAKKSQTMQIAPYLTLPVKRNTLFNFLLIKEFTNIWNLYLFFMIVPFVFRAIPSFYGFSGAIVYLLFFYLLCVGNSLLVNIANNLLNRNGWYLFLPIIIVAAIAGITFIPGVTILDGIVKAGEFILEKNIIAWVIVLLVAGALWKINLSMMNTEIYKAMQGKKITEAGTSFSLPFLDKLGKMGMFINLDVKMILRSKRLKQQLFVVIFFVVYYFFMINTPAFKEVYFFPLFFTMFVIGGMGLIMSQFLFTSESSFFDGLMTRNLSMLDMLKGKYIFYFSYSVLMLLILTILVFTGQLDFLFLISIFFYTTGFLFFLMFQNAVYNKSFFDLSESGLFNWKGTSGNMLLVTMLGMFIPIILVSIINGIFGVNAANYFMLITGFIFTVTVKYWLTWTYNRFLKRKYKNMDGFRSNT